MKRLSKYRLTSLLAACLFLPTGLLIAQANENHWAPGTVYIMEGHTNFYIYAIAEHLVLFDGKLVCHAALTITGKDTFRMDTIEYFPDGGTRVAVKEGTITPAGRVSFDYEGEVEALQIHVGITAHGRGVVDGVAIYKGLFDGISLYASWELLGLQTTPALLPWYQKVPSDPSILFDGPISVYEDFNLEVVDMILP